MWNKEFWLQLIQKRYLLFLIAVVLNVLLHAPFLNRPPEGVHVWRQCNTLAVARNFYREDMTLWKPRVDNRFNKSGVTGMNFPLYEWTVAIGYKIFGEHNWISRCVSLLVYLLGALGIYQIIQSLSKSHAVANMGAFAYLFFPDIFYFGITALPDIMALTCMIWGFYYFISTMEEYKLKTLIFSYLFLTFAGLIKLYFLLVGFPILALFIGVLRVWPWKRLLVMVLGGVFILAISLGWYVYANWLIHVSGLRDFELTVRYQSDIALAINTLIRNITSDLPELILNFANTVFFLTALYFFFKKDHRSKVWFWPALFMVVGIVVYHILELEQMEHHSYYMMPYYPFFAIIVAFGTYQLLKNGYVLVCVALLALNPVMATVRIVYPRWINADKAVPEELYQESLRKQLQSYSDKEELCLILPDQSNCIFFYYLDRKGVSYSHVDTLFSKNYRVQKVKNCGVKTIYFYNKSQISNIDSLFRHQCEVKDSVGKFYILNWK
jgi:hypothetical protein